jgi:hypothetical protein
MLYFAGICRSELFNSRASDYPRLLDDGI